VIVIVLSFGKLLHGCIEYLSRQVPPESKLSPQGKNPMADSQIMELYFSVFRNNLTTKNDNSKQGDLHDR